MADALERRSMAEGYTFNAKEGRLRCMPHTIHLAALHVSIFNVVMFLAAQ